MRLSESAEWESYTLDKWIIFIATAFVAGIISAVVQDKFSVRIEGPLAGRLILDMIPVILGAIMYALLFA